MGFSAKSPGRKLEEAETRWKVRIEREKENRVNVMRRTRLVYFTVTIAVLSDC